MPDAVSQLLASEAALEKLGARGIPAEAAEQTLWNRHVLIANRRGRTERRQSQRRRLLIGQTNGGRPLTFVIEQTDDPTTWLLVTGWESTPAERMIFDSHAAQRR